MKRCDRIHVGWTCLVAIVLLIMCTVYALIIHSHCLFSRYEAISPPDNTPCSPYGDASCFVRQSASYFCPDTQWTDTFSYSPNSFTPLMSILSCDFIHKLDISFRSLHEHCSCLYIIPYIVFILI